MRLRLSPLICCLLFALPVACTATSDKQNPPPSDDAGPPAVPDEDGDGISDDDEGRAQGIDTDGDGKPDFQDDDSDGDGILDSVEAGDTDPATPPVDSDGDGIIDALDTDSDGNGRTDAVDGADDLDGDGKPDFADLDDDADGLPDTAEIGADVTAPIDSDGDGRPDFRDTDSDNDTINDIAEGTYDVDNDGIPAYLDTDADGDGILDSIEAGDLNPDTPPDDSDGDGGADFLDIDSDNDGLLDALEDPNHNGILDPGESDPKLADTDMDGVSDLVEVAAGTNPNDGLDNPQAHGDFVFTVPWHAPPSPTQDTLDFATDISQADVVFALDTTGSMGGEISNLTTGLQPIIAQLAVAIPSIGIGVTEYKDFPTGNYGGGSDQPFILKHRVMSVLTPAGQSSVQSAVASLSADGGNDGPESGWEALYQIATGAGTTQGSASVPPFNPASAPPLAIPAGESVGVLGGVGFRAGSLPIVVQITDAPSHNGTRPADNYVGFSSASYTSALHEITSLGGRFVGIVTRDGEFAPAKANLISGAVATGSVVPPTAWGTPGTTRPANCAVDQCCTGENGAGEPPQNNKCPLVFTVSGSGTGLSSSIVQAIKVLTTYVTLDISATAVDDASDTVDAVSAFVDKIKANATAASPCSSGLTVTDRNVDGIAETFTNVFPGPTVCFDVVPRQNSTVRPTTEPQMFRASIVVTGDNVTTLGTRNVFFLVPPEIPAPPIN